MPGALAGQLIVIERSAGRDSRCGGAARQVGGAVGVAMFAAILAAQPGETPVDAFRAVIG